MAADATCGTASPKHCLPPLCLSQLLHSSRPLSALFLPQKHHNLSKQRVLKEASREGRGRLNVSSGTHSSGLSQPRLGTEVVFPVEVCSPERSSGPTGPLLCSCFPVNQFPAYTGACSSLRAGFCNSHH